MNAPRRESRRPLSGVLLLDKPLGLSSNAALQQARRLYRAEKAGHTGTLDPLATGLLPVCFGEATKFAHALLGGDKTYQATIRLGVTTTTGDAEGETTRTCAVDVRRQDIERVLPRFVGPINQTPPRYAALKYQGRSYYAYAREGVDIPRVAREVVVHELKLEGWNDPEVHLTVRCGKGTYIRVLAEDIGAALGCGAHLSALRRVASGGFDIAGARGLDALALMSETERDAQLFAPDALLAALPRLDLVAIDAQRFAQGQVVTRDGLADGIYRAYANGAFAGLAVARAGAARPKRLLSGAR